MKTTRAKSPREDHPRTAAAHARASTRRETDLYAPVKRLLESQGFTVKAEVGACDVLAVRGDEPPVVVELKLTLGLDLLLQAVDRLALTPTVYLAVPRNCAPLARRGRPVTKLLRMLGLGLIAVSTARGGRAVVMLDPGEYRPRVTPARRERLLGEFARREGDRNVGGSNRRGGVFTVYRQRAVAIAEVLARDGPTKAAVVAKTVNDAQARAVLYGDAYGWFERVGTGVYGLTSRGREELPRWLSNA